MKFHILISFLLFTFCANGQIKEDQWLIGGNGLFSHSKSNEIKTISFQLSPGIGYFFKDKFAGGIRLGINSDTYKSDVNHFRNSSISVGPFLRYYLLSLEQKVNFFIDGAFGYSWNKYKSITFPGSYKYHHYNLNFLAGPAVFLNEHTALEITVGYNYASRGPVDSTSTNKFQVGIGLQVHLGKNSKKN